MRTKAFSRPQRFLVRTGYWKRFFLAGLIASNIGILPLFPAEIFVAANGRDDNPGTREKPLATFSAARDFIRRQRAAHTLSGEITVEVRGGSYALTQTLQLGPDDSGVTYRAYKQEHPVITGGRVISGFTPYKGKILKADVGAQGFRDIYFRQLFFDNQLQHLARYPNYDPANPYSGGWAYADGQLIPRSKDIPGEDKRSFHYKPSDARNWSRPEEGEIFIYSWHNWWNNIVRIQSVDTVSNTLTLAGDCSYAIRPGDRYYAQNLFEELDSPGEWYLDKKDWILYFWPPSPMEGKSVTAPVLRTLVEMQPGARGIVFNGFTFECAAGTGISMKETTDCLVAASVTRNVGDYNGSGININGGTGNGVAGCDIYNTGSHGVVINGGDRITLTPGNNFADNNYIHHVGLFNKNGTGISLSGCGNRASHNLIHDGPRMGIIFGGNNLVIEYNHVHHVNLETEDTGAIYTGGRDWISSRGSVIRYNYFHDSIGFAHDDKGEWHSPQFAWGIYLDDNAGGVDVIGNIVARCSRGALHLHNARDNLIENNIFVDGGPQQIDCGGWTKTNPSWIRNLPTMIKGYDSVIQQPAWKTMRHMDLAPSDAVLPDGTIMAGNVLRKNILFSHDSKTLAYKTGNMSFDHNTIDFNLIWCGGDVLSHTPKLADWKSWQEMGNDIHSVIDDPLFVDADHDDFRLRPNSPAFELGFQAIPVEKIGPYKDPLRASWPIIEAEGASGKTPTPP